MRAIVERKGVLDYTARLAENEVERALEAMAGIPASAHRDALEALARFAVSRSN